MPDTPAPPAERSPTVSCTRIASWQSTVCRDRCHYHKLAPALRAKRFSLPALQNFAIFRNAFYHLIHHQNLYAQFQFEQWDFYRYSPAFALLFAPFALLPYQIGAVLWNLLNAVALYWAVRSVPSLDQRPKMLALWFMFLAMLNSVANAQSNALVAVFMIAAWSAEERETRPFALFIVLATSIKLFKASSKAVALPTRPRAQSNFPLRFPAAARPPYSR